MVIKFKYILFLLFVGLFNPIFSDVLAFNNAPEWITVYVHGTQTSTGLKLLNKFCKHVIYGQPGIHHISELPKNALFWQDVEMLHNKSGGRFDREHFYTFGWSGKLSFKVREQEGLCLYQELQALVKAYREKYGYCPKLRIMTFSHGGNVALNMVRHLPFFAGEQIYLELLLIACPVQKITEPFIQHPAINHIYTIASSRDLLQVVDWYKYKNKRYFPDRFFHVTQQNCTQIKVNINDRGLGHLDLLRSFMYHLPSVLDMADNASRKNNLTSLKPIAPCSKIHALKLCTQKPCIIECHITDTNFRFYNGFNLIPCVYGRRKS